MVTHYDIRLEANGLDIRNATYGPFRKLEDAKSMMDYFSMRLEEKFENIIRSRKETAYKVTFLDRHGAETITLEIEVMRDILEDGIIFEKNK